MKKLTAIFFALLICANAFAGIGGQGPINNTPIGATTPSTGKFTTLQATTSATLAAASSPGESVLANDYIRCYTIGASDTNVSFTNASPTVMNGIPVLSASMGMSGLTQTCPFRITANAPTGLALNTNYWYVYPGNHVASSAANALAGTYLNTTGSSSTATVVWYATLTTNTLLPLAAFSSIGGQYDCTFQGIFLPAATTSVTDYLVALSTDGTTVPDYSAAGNFISAANVPTATNIPMTLLTPPIALGGGGTNYAIAKSVFTVAGMNATANVKCRRMF